MRVNYRKGGRFEQNARLGQVWAGELAALIWQPFRIFLKPKTSKVRTCFGVQSTKRKVVNITAVVQTMSFMLEFVPKKMSKVTKALVSVTCELTNTFMVIDLTDNCKNHLPEIQNLFNWRTKHGNR